MIKRQVRLKKPNNQNRPYFGDDDSESPILHIDMDSFFASCEMLKNPELKDKPVIVGEGDRAVVSAANYVARSFGVHSAMPTFRAKQLCPEGVFLPVDMEFYQAISRKVFEVFRSVSYKVEAISVDEAFLDAAPAKALFGSPVEVAKLIRQRVSDEIGITCSVGIAQSKSVAKIASNYAKPDGYLLIPKSHTLDFLNPLPVWSLWGVGPQTLNKLEGFGVKTVRDLANLPEAAVHNLLGVANGEKLLRWSRGEDNREVVETAIPQKLLGKERTLREDTRDFKILNQQLHNFSRFIASELRRDGLSAKTLTLVITTSDHVRHTRSFSFPSGKDTAYMFHKTARSLLEQFLSENALDIRLIGISVSSFKPADGEIQKQTLLESVDGKSERMRNAEIAMLA